MNSSGDTRLQANTKMGILLWHTCISRKRSRRPPIHKYGSRLFNTQKKCPAICFYKKRGGGGCPMHDNFGNIALKFIDVPTERIQSSWLLSSPPPHPQSSRILNISGKCHWISTNIEKIAEKLHQNCQLFMPRFFG